MPENLAKASARELEASKEYDPFIRRIRMAFWQEYELAASRMRTMTLAAVAKRMGHPSRTIEAAMRNSWDLAFIMCPPETYDNFLDEAHFFAMKRLRNEVLELPIHNEDGTVNTKVADIILKAALFFEVRKNGMPKQRIEQTTMHGTVKEFAQIAQNRSLDEVDRRIAELEAQGVKAIIDSGGKVPTRADIDVSPPLASELPDPLTLKKMTKAIDGVV